MLTRHGDVRPFSDPLGPSIRSQGALSNDVHMSPPRRREPPNGQGVLANLPRTRPQRASARRAAARNASAAPTASGRRGRELQRRAAPKPRWRGAERRPPSAVPPRRASRPPPSAPAAPRSARRSTPEPRRRRAAAGFECEGERARGPVQPPGGRSWWPAPRRSSASWRRPGSRPASACSRTCSRACRSPERRRLCILPRNAELPRLRSRQTGDPLRIESIRWGESARRGP